MRKEAFIHSFRPILPKTHLPQQKIVEWTMASHQRCQELQTGSDAIDLSSLMRFCVSPDQIGERYFECDDVNLNWSEHEIYHLTPEAPLGAGLFKRNNFFSKRATEIFEEIYQDATVPQHLIHVTCTGYVSPSPAQRYFSTNKKAPAITHAYHMGCYASLPSVRLGEALIHTLNAGQRVDLVHTEMCSLHHDPSAHTPEQIVVQSLFADGHMKYSLSGQAQGPSFKIKTIKEKLIPHSEDDMTWVPSSFGMKMTLSREVPGKIGEELLSFLQEMSQESGYDFLELQKKAIFAVHPGGPKIINAVAAKLELSAEQIEASVKVLKERGNMSSATLPHVWNEILLSQPESGQMVISLAFGPGLTIFGSIFEVSR